LLDGLHSKLTSSRWAAIAMCSPDTALQDIADPMAYGGLPTVLGLGLNTGYELAD
jgi:hypothetical protein